MLPSKLLRSTLLFPRVLEAENRSLWSLRDSENLCLTRFTLEYYSRAFVNVGNNIHVKDPYIIIITMGSQEEGFSVFRQFMSIQRGYFRICNRHDRPNVGNTGNENEIMPVLYTGNILSMFSNICNESQGFNVVG